MTSLSFCVFCLRLMIFDAFFCLFTKSSRVCAEWRAVLRASAPGQRPGSCNSSAHRTPLYQPRYRIDSSSSVLKKLSQLASHDSNYSPRKIQELVRLRRRIRANRAEEITYSHYELMRSGHCFQAIFLYELVRYVLSKCVAGSAGWNAPACPIVRIRP